MTDVLNRGPQGSPNVPPSNVGFNANKSVLAPEQFIRPETQQLRNRQSKQGQGFALGQVSYLENQQHKAQYKRVNTDQTDAELVELIKVAKTARTILMNNIQEWAGNLNEEELEAALPTIWAHYVQVVQAQDNPASEEVVVEELPELEETEATLVNLDEMEPVQIINRPDVPADTPKTGLQVPAEPTLGEILGKVEEDNEGA